jgi:ankyrin repeat protein
MARNRPIMKVLLARADVRSKYLDRGVRGWRRPMEIAIDLDDLVSVQMLLDAGADPLAGLFHAIPRRSRGFIEVIIKAVKRGGGDISSRESMFRETPLHLAARRGDPEVVELLLEAGADLWARSPRCEDPPIHAAMGSRPATALRLLKAMLDCGDPEAETDWKLDVWHSAFGVSGHTELVQILIDQGVDIFARSKEGKTALETIEEGGRTRRLDTWPSAHYEDAPDVAAVLLKADPYIWPQGHINRRLWELARQGPVEESHLTLLNLLVRTGKSALELGSDTNSGELTALHYVCHWVRGSIHTSGAGSDSGDPSPMMASLLLDHGASISAQCDQGETPLLRAVANNQLAMLRLMLKARPQDPAINIANRYGMTPLSEAASRRNPAAIKLLLDAGANISAMGPGGTALHYAASSRCKGSMRLLLDAGCPASAVTSSLETALDQAILHNFTAAIQMLVDAGCPVLNRNAFGGTALRMAAWGGHLASIDELIRVAGADIVKLDDNGSGDLVCVALTREARSPHSVEAVARLLVDHGASVHADCKKCDIPERHNLKKGCGICQEHDPRFRRWPGLVKSHCRNESGSGKSPKSGRKLVSLQTISKGFKGRLSNAGRRAAS